MTVPFLNERIMNVLGRSCTKAAVTYFKVISL